MKQEYRVTVPEPCTESWDEMAPAGQGRFCAKCCKVVVDFTTKTTDEIVAHLLAAGKKGVCGNALEVQLAPVPVRRTLFPRMRLFTAALYVVFGALLFTGCTARKRRHTQVRGGFMIQPAGQEKSAVNKELDPHSK